MYKVVHADRFVKYHYTLLQPRKPVPILHRHGRFSVFRVETWLNGFTYVRVVERSGRAQRVMSLDWQTYVPLRPQYQVQTMQVANKAPVPHRVNQLTAVRIPAIPQLGSVAVTAPGLAFLRGTGDTLWLWLWEAKHPVELVKSWPPMRISPNGSGQGTWVDGTTLQMQWKAGAVGNPPWWVESWNLVDGWHHLLAIIGPGYPVQPSQSFGSSAYPEFGYQDQLSVGASPRRKPVHLPKHLTSDLAFGNDILAKRNGRYGIYDWRTHTFTGLAAPTPPGNSESLGATLWGGGDRPGSTPRFGRPRSLSRWLWTRRWDTRR